MKKLSLLLVLLLTIFLAACANDTPEPIEPPVENTEDSTDTTNEPVDETPADDDTDATDNQDEPVEEEPVEEEPASEPGRLNSEGEIELTIEDLAYFNGRDGKKAYVAVEGVIYDMTDSVRWTNGQHNGFSAGQDLTNAINEISPHGPSFLSRVPQVGIIVTSYSEDSE